MSYEEFLQKRFFDPLGMTETTFWPADAQMARLAGAYGPNKEKNGYARGSLGYLTKPLSDRTHRFPEAGGGLFSTTHDILRYGLMLANDGAYGTDLSVNPKTGMVAVFMVQCPGPDQWAARDLFLKTATQVFKDIAP